MSEATFGELLATAASPAAAMDLWLDVDSARGEQEALTKALSLSTTEKELHDMCERILIHAHTLFHRDYLSQIFKRADELNVPKRTD